MFCDKQGRLYELTKHNDLRPFDLATQVRKVHVQPDRIKLNCSNKGQDQVRFLILTVSSTDPGRFETEFCESDLGISMAPGNLLDYKQVGPISFLINKDRELTFHSYANHIKEYIPEYQLDENYFPNVYKVDGCFRYFALLDSDKHLYIFPKLSLRDRESEPESLVENNTGNDIDDNREVSHSSSIDYSSIQRLFVYSKPGTKNLPEIKKPIVDDNGVPLLIKQIKCYNYCLCLVDRDNFHLMIFDDQFRYTLENVSDLNPGIKISLHKDVFVQQSRCVVC